MRTTVRGVVVALLLLCVSAAGTAHAQPAAVASGAPAGVSSGVSSGSPTAGSRAMGWYLALGDSLAAGYLHGTGDHRTDGYVGPTLAAVQDRTPKTKLVNLACSGETTTSMITGGRCDYEEGSQLAAAVEFLRAHSRTTRLVTIDIGGNDVATCGFVLLPTSCTDPALDTLRTNLPVILDALREAAGPHVQIIVLDYYDPFLVYWLRLGPDAPLFRLAALSSVTLLTGPGGVNDTIAAAAAGADAEVANIEGAFSTTAFTPTLPFPEHGDVPLNVIRICQWTTMCSNLDFHPNPEGYAVIARAVIARLQE
ncbi:GDSL-type esterase/lipase family protein [Humibacillus xanthopallidus]|uniref:GDSL-type esterase/lipase family protein n=1 Tax=Humibacillus xanthopallidus TaxID=412689 RepID=UPI00385025D9